MAETEEKTCPFCEGYVKHERHGEYWLCSHCNKAWKSGASYRRIVKEKEAVNGHPD
jgi:ribosomal protein L37AE/L43A